MHTAHPASLLVAALVMLRRPCARNQAAAQLLLERAAENTELSPVEREVCRNLADDLDRERHQPPRAHAERAGAPRPRRGVERRLVLVSAPPFAHNLKGFSA